MLTFTIVLSVLVGISVLMFIIPDNSDSEIRHFLSAAMVVIFLLVLLCELFEVAKAYNKSDFYNKKFGTNYSAEDVYWNKETIEKQLLGEKYNININKEN